MEIITVPFSSELNLPPLIRYLNDGVIDILKLATESTEFM
jgi:hypothetical protein